MSKKIRILTAIEEYLIAKEAAGLSQGTLRDYGDTFKKTKKFFDDDPFLDEIEPIRFQKLLIEYKHLKSKTRRNMCVALSSLYQYHLMQNNVEENVIHKFKWPKPDILSPDPLTDDELKKVFHNATVITWWHPSLCKYYQSPARNIHRNRAIMILLLDTGIRAGELCGLKINNLTHCSIKVFGKGSKERRIPISELSYEAIMRYWQLERGEISNNGYVFLNGNKKPITPNSLYRMMLRLGKRSDIHLHPHRFRHTFAINFIRNQGNIYVLQKILGHTSLDMVKRYLKLAESDVTEAHKKASPLRHLKFDPLADYKAV